MTVMPFHLADASEEGSLLSYGKGAVLLYDEPNRLQEGLKGFLKEDATHRQQHFTWSELMQTNQCTCEIAFNFLQQRVSGLAGFDTIGLQSKSMMSFERQMPLLMDEIQVWLQQGRQVVLVMNNLQRREGLERALREENIGYEHGESLSNTGQSVLIVSGLLSEGFELPLCNLVVVTEGNIFGQQKRKLRKKVPKGQEITYFTDLTPGDYVVHALHGIGKYIGLKLSKQKVYIRIILKLPMLVQISYFYQPII